VPARAPAHLQKRAATAPLDRPTTCRHAHRLPERRCPCKGRALRLSLARIPVTPSQHPCQSPRHACVKKAVGVFRSRRHRPAHGLHTPHPPFIPPDPLGVTRAALPLLSCALVVTDTRNAGGAGESSWASDGGAFAGASQHTVQTCAAGATAVKAGRCPCHRWVGLYRSLYGRHGERGSQYRLSYALRHHPNCATSPFPALLRRATPLGGPSRPASVTMAQAAAAAVPPALPPVGKAPLPPLFGDDVDGGIVLMGPHGRVLEVDSSSSDTGSFTTVDGTLPKDGDVAENPTPLDEPVDNGMEEDPPWTSVLETRFGMGLEGAAGKDMVYTFATSLPLAIVMARVEETAAAHMPQWQVRKRTVVVKRKVQLKTLVRVRCRVMLSEEWCAVRRGEGRDVLRRMAVRSSFCTPHYHGGESARELVLLVLKGGLGLAPEVSVCHSELFANHWCFVLPPLARVRPCSCCGLSRRLFLAQDVKGNLRGKTVPVKKTILLVTFHVGGELVMTFKTEAAKGANTSDTSVNASASGAPIPGIPSPLQSNADFGDDANASGGAALSHPTITSAPSVGPGWTEFTRVTLQTKGQHHFTTAFVKFVLCIRSRSHTLRLYNDACKHIHHSVAVYPSEVPKATIW